MHRRNLLKYVGLSATGLLGAAPTHEAAAAPAYQGNKQNAIWVHGNALEVEDPGAVLSISRVGMGTLLRGKPGKFTWVHLPFSTPVIVNEARPAFEKVFVFYKTKSCSIRNVHIFDGPNRVKAFDGLQLEGDRSGDIVPTNTWQLNPKLTIFYALGITLGVQFHIGFDTQISTEFLVTTAGADFRL